MLRVLNKLCHGYVFVPVNLSLRSKGFFELLADGKPRTIDTIADTLNANSGPLSVGVEMMIVMKWLRELEPGLFVSDPSVEDVHLIPEGINELYAFTPSELVGTSAGGEVLSYWLERCADGWGCEPVLSQLIDGPIILSMLIGMAQTNLMMEFLLCNSKVLPPVKAMQKMLLKRKWVVKKENDELQLNGVGKFMFGRTLVGGVTASYRPLLNNITETMFGDADTILMGDNNGETHIDRALNVQASGFTNEKYFKDFKAIVVELFSDQNDNIQLDYVVDTGCGDGSLLKTLHHLIKTEARADVTMVGIDLNPIALIEAATNLCDIQNVLIVGDVGSPERIAKDLEEHFGENIVRVLHVRSFLDHNRIFIPPKNNIEKVALTQITQKSLGIADGGGVLKAEEMQQNLFSHLLGWTRILKNNGLLCLEVHSMSNWAKNMFFDIAEGLHFDALHSFSRQYLCEPAIFLAAMAEVGLFPDRYFERYPKQMPYTRITLGYFESREWTISFATNSDLDLLASLEWAQLQGFNLDLAAILVAKSPGSSFILRDKDGRVKAALFYEQGDFDFINHSRSYSLAISITKKECWSKAIMGHALRMFSVLDGETVFAETKEPQMFSPVDIRFT